MNGLKDGEIHIGDAAVRDIIRFYTREAGVRNLEREISKILYLEHYHNRWYLFTLALHIPI